MKRGIRYLILLLTLFMVTGLNAESISASSKLTYVKVNLRTEREYVYYQGKLKATVKVNTGRPGSDATPRGTFHILYKQRNTVLRGNNSNGTRYASFVHYWEPITWNGVGLHDASWVPANAFGNPKFRNYYGSHGCINNPTWEMPTVWKYTHTGETVTVY